MSAKPRVYLETSIIGFLSSRPSVNVHTASKQAFTHDWWRDERDRFETFVSRVVIEEVSAGDQDAAAERLRLLDGIPVLVTPNAALTLTRSLMEFSGLPAKAEADASHMALAAIHGMDYLLTWNCKHIANAVLRPKIVEVCMEAGFRAPIMCTPEELSHV